MVRNYLHKFHMNRCNALSCLAAAGVARLAVLVQASNDVRCTLSYPIMFFLHTLPLSYWSSRLLVMGGAISSEQSCFFCDDEGSLQGAEGTVNVSA